MEFLSLFWITSILGAMGTITYWFISPFKMLFVYYGWIFVEITSNGDKIRATHYLKKLQKMEKHTSVITYKNDREIPTGLVISLYPLMIANIDVTISKDWRLHTTEYINISLFCSRKNFTEIFEKDKPQEKAKNSVTMKILTRLDAGFYNPDYDLQIVEAPDVTFDCFKEQSKVIDQIISLWMSSLENKCRKIAFLIHGESGNGKSEIAAMITTKLQGTICTEYDPTKPGDKINRLHKTSEASKDNPLILLIDEWDVHLKKVWNNEIKLNDDYATEVYDRSSHNRWMDLILNGPYIPYTIVIFTTNKTPAELKEITDESCMRRFHIIENHEKAEFVLSKVREKRYGKEIKID